MYNAYALMTMQQKVSFNIIPISLNIPHNYFGDPNEIIFRSVSS